MAKRVATVGIFTALAIILSYVEALIPFNFDVPGIKLGIANLAIVVGLYKFKIGDVCFISFIRIFIIGIMFGNGASFIYSLCGGILSLFVMFVFMKTKLFSIIGVSIAGAVFHNIGQILAAFFVMKSVSIIFYLPVLMIVAIVTGFLIGILSVSILKVTKKISID